MGPVSASVLYVRNLPPKVRRSLQAEAKARGVSEAEVARQLLEESAVKLTAARSRSRKGG